MTDQLTLYNGALARVGERALASLAENREPRRVLDGFYAPTLNYCLQQGLWYFAIRTVQTDAAASIAPTFAFNYAFPAPNDFVRTLVISTAPELDPPLTQYKFENNIAYANFSPLYWAYVSNDNGYGFNLGAWPESFADFVQARLAWKAAPRIVTDINAAFIKELKQEEIRTKRIAKANDAMNEGPQFPPVPFWVRARRGAFQPGMPVFAGFGFSN
jgi:hypothetical protein